VQAKQKYVQFGTAKAALNDGELLLTKMFAYTYTYFENKLNKTMPVLERNIALKGFNDGVLHPILLFFWT
jgi:hypothetical protein